jgi:NAD(P)-dependent dehydrogenase (short-subunit alcohol dehydrogenase family)
MTVKLMKLSRSASLPDVPPTMKANWCFVCSFHLSGFFHVFQVAVEQMPRQQFGHVVSITASLASQPIAGVASSLTNLTKGGLESVTRALAIEFAGEVSVSMPLRQGS